MSSKKVHEEVYIWSIFCYILGYFHCKMVDLYIEDTLPQCSDWGVVTGSPPSAKFLTGVATGSPQREISHQR